MTARDAMPTAVSMLAALGSNLEHGLTHAEALARLARDGPNEVPERPAHPVLRFIQKFWGLSAWMIELIAILSLALGKHADLAVALALLMVNAVISFLQEQRASAAVAALRHRLQVTARVLRDGAWQMIPARELVRGDVVRVRAGDFVPADAQVLEGAAEADQSTLTGETRAVEKAPNDVLYSGSIARQGEVTGVVTATGARTYFGRTTELVERAEPKLHVEEVVSRVVRWLFAIVGTLVAVAVVMSMIEGLRLTEILPLALVLLMSAIPVALPVMFTVSMAVGSIELARRGVLVTRLSAAEDAAHMDVLCADKTGTLTVNRLTLAGTAPLSGFTEDDVVRCGAWASNDANQDPIDLAFLSAARARGLSPPSRVRSFVPFSPATRRTEAMVEVEGRDVRVSKGALHTIAEAAHVEPSLLTRLEARAVQEATRGVRVLAVASADGNEPAHVVGLAFLSDAVRPDSRQLIQELGALGVAVKMLTGDALPVARDVARTLGLGAVASASDLRAAREHADAADLTERSAGFAEIFPEDKFLIVQSLQAAGHVVGMTGDGVNDAPALRQAEVGIAVSTATDVAKGAASVVLTTEGLANAVDLVKNGRAIYQRVLTWIINKVSRTILKSGFVVLAFLATGRFVISALGMVLLVFMTDFVKVSLATDRVRPSERPESWKIGPLVRIAVILGLCLLAEALGLLGIAWRRFGLVHDAGRLQMFTFQTLLFFALFSLVSIRERRFFWASRPSATLAMALTGDATIGLLIAAFGLGELRPLPAGQVACIVIYATVFALFVNDLIKVRLMRFIRPLPSATAS
jgi:H+-transporting ATPase